MKRFNPVLLLILAIFASCNSAKETKTAMDNPFLKPYETPFEVPPFDQIEIEHYLPAVEQSKLSTSAQQ